MAAFFGPLDCKKKKKKERKSVGSKGADPLIPFRGKECWITEIPRQSNAYGRPSRFPTMHPSGEILGRDARPTPVPAPDRIAPGDGQQAASRFFSDSGCAGTIPAGKKRPIYDAPRNQVVELAGWGVLPLITGQGAPGLLVGGNRGPYNPTSGSPDGLVSSEINAVSPYLLVMAVR